MRTLKNSQRGEISAWTIILMATLVGAGVFYYQKATAEKVAELASLKDTHYDWNLYTLDGRTIPFSNFKGKTIFLNFFGTRCGPCMYEIPAIQKMFEKVRDKGVEVVVLSSEDEATLSNFVASHSVTFPVYRFQPPIDIGDSAEGIPQTYIIAPNGKIVLKHVDPDAWDSDANVQFILSLAKKYPAS